MKIITSLKKSHTFDNNDHANRLSWRPHYLVLHENYHVWNIIIYMISKMKKSWISHNSIIHENYDDDGGIIMVSAWNGNSNLIMAAHFIFSLKVNLGNFQVIMTYVFQSWAVWEQVGWLLFCLSRTDISRHSNRIGKTSNAHTS